VIFLVFRCSFFFILVPRSLSIYSLDLSQCRTNYSALLIWSIFYGLQNGYNLPLLISPTTIAYPGKGQGLECGTPICSIGNIYSFCQPPNFLTGGPGFGCYNVAGPGPVPTAGTEQFANACPDAYSYSNDDVNHVYHCTNATDYEVVFCP
jgi:hypothetical protein